MAIAVQPSNIPGFLTVGTASPPTAAAFAGNKFYLNSTTNRLYALNGSTVISVGTASTTTPTEPSTPTALKRLLVIGSSVRQGSGPGEPTYVSTRGPLYLAALADGYQFTPVGFRSDVTRQGTPGAHSAQGGMRFQDGNVYNGLQLIAMSKAAVPDGADLLITLEGGLNEFPGYSTRYDDFCAKMLTYARNARSNFPLATIVLEGIGASQWIPKNILDQVKTDVKDVFVAEHPKNFAIDTYAVYPNYPAEGSAPDSDFTDSTHPTLAGAIKQGNDIWRQIRDGVINATVTPPVEPPGTTINSVSKIIQDMTTWSDGTSGGTVNPLYAPNQNFLIGCCVRGGSLPASTPPAFVGMGHYPNFNNCAQYIKDGCTWSGYQNMNWVYWLLWAVLFEGRGNASNNVAVEIRRARTRYRRSGDKTWGTAFGANAANWFTVEQTGLVWRDPQGRIDTRTSSEGNQIMRLWRNGSGGGDNCYHATVGSQAGGATSNGSFNASAIINAGIDCVWGKMDFRIVPWDSGQSLGTHEWYGYVGLDPYPTQGNPYQGSCRASGRFDPPGMSSGRMIRLTTDWKPVQFATLREARIDAVNPSLCSITSASFQANPPTAAMLAD